MAVDFTKLCDHILAALLYRNWASLTLPSLNSHWMSERLCGRQLWLCAKTALSQRLPSILSLDSAVAPGPPGHWFLVVCVRSGEEARGSLGKESGVWKLLSTTGCIGRAWLPASNLATEGLPF